MTPTHVVLYSRENCGFCDRALARLERAGIACLVVDVTHDDEAKSFLRSVCAREGVRPTVPQIFLGEVDDRARFLADPALRIGGHDELVRYLERDAH